MLFALHTRFWYAASSFLANNPNIEILCCLLLAVIIECDMVVLQNLNNWVFHPIWHITVQSGNVNLAIIIFLIFWFHSNFAFDILNGPAIWGARGRYPPNYLEL